MRNLSVDTKNCRQKILIPALKPKNRIEESSETQRTHYKFFWQCATKKLDGKCDKTAPLPTSYPQFFFRTRNFPKYMGQTRELFRTVRHTNPTKLW